MLRLLATGEPLAPRIRPLLDGRFQPRLDEGQNVLVADPASNALQKLAVRDRVEVFRQVRIHHIRVSGPEMAMHAANRSTALRWGR
jgi:hypothetical protein